MTGEVSDKAAKGNDDYVDAFLISAYPLRPGRTNMSVLYNGDLPEIHEVFNSNKQDYWG